MLDATPFISFWCFFRSSPTHPLSQNRRGTKLYLKLKLRLFIMRVIFLTAPESRGSNFGKNDIAFGTSERHLKKNVGGGRRGQLLASKDNLQYGRIDQIPKRSHTWIYRRKLGQYVYRTATKCLIQVKGPGDFGRMKTIIQIYGYFSRKIFRKRYLDIRRPPSVTGKSTAPKGVSKRSWAAVERGRRENAGDGSCSGRTGGGVRFQTSI